MTSPGDRSTRTIFGDGAGAAVLRAGGADDAGAIGPFVLGSDGSGADLIMVPGGGSKLPQHAPGYAEEDRYFVMQGQPVYRRAIEIDTQQPEAHYNLGYVMLERGEARTAAAYFEQLNKNLTELTLAIKGLQEAK